ncbi:MAG: glucose-6-phosphate dehydrogenase [Gemmataceae bacterium]
MNTTASSLSIVIFGASGDLTARKLVPALYRLFDKGRLNGDFRIVGVARSAMNHDQFRAHLASSLREQAPEKEHQRWAEFAPHIFYLAADASQANGLTRLRDWLTEQEGSAGGNRLYYLSVSPDLYAGIAAQLDETGMSREETGWRRLIIEKPFGRDWHSARQLNRTLHQHFREEQLYRIDHYLGKETVQNILIFRFANTLFEPVWNHNFIDHVQITVAEAVPVGSRGPYYDRAGVLRDMLQSHLLQVLTLATMEPPARFAADPLRNEKMKVLDAIPVYTAAEAADNVVTGQYEGYHSEKGVAADSTTPTFAAVRLFINNWRWQGVPIYLRSGKCMSRRVTEVTIQFRCPPHLMFPLPPGATLQCNRLTLCLQPCEGIRLNFQSKVPDQAGVQLRPVDLRFDYQDAYADVPIPEAYERLLQDALAGDASLFMRGDEIERSWEIMDPLIAATEDRAAPLPAAYPVGSLGPARADEFLTRDGRHWILT